MQFLNTNDLTFETFPSRFNFTEILMFVGPCIIVQFIQKNPTRCNSVSKFIIPYLYEAQHVSGNTPPIIRSLKRHWQPLELHTWKVVGRVVAGRCQAEYFCVSKFIIPYLYMKLNILCLTAFSNHTCNNLPGMQNQRLLVQF